MRILAIAILWLAGAVGPAVADEAAVYLVRHAEKQSGEDPGLTPKGQARAQALATLMAGVDIAKIYSTDYKRTRDTAAPTANAKGLDVELYDPRAFRDYATALKQEFLDQKKSILVVGHSNTTPYLATLLTGEQHPMLSDDQYDHIYVIRASEDGSLRATIEKFGAH